MTKTGSLCGLIGAGLLLAGCVASGQPDYPLQCIAELNPPGAYGYPAGIAAPTVVPEAGGTQAGADAVNACVKAKVAAVSAVPAPVAKPRKAVVETQSASGAMTAQTYTYATPPRAANAKPIPPSAAPMTSPPPPQACSYAMTGGTGYTCDRSPILRRN